MSGLSPRNLKYMRKFAKIWPDRVIVQRSVAQLPWWSNRALIDKLDHPETRLWDDRNAEAVQLMAMVKNNFKGLGV